MSVLSRYLDPEVLSQMRKPGPKVFRNFLKAQHDISAASRVQQYVLPYLMAALCPRVTCR